MTINSLTTRPSADLQPFDRLRQEMDLLFESVLSSSNRFSSLMPSQQAFSVSPSIDVAEDDKTYIVTADVPGLEDKYLTVEFKNKVLTIKGEKKLQHEEKNYNYYIAERWSGSFSRSIQLPSPINENDISAQVKDGVLQIMLPKIEDSKKELKSIEVKKG